MSQSLIRAISARKNQLGIGFYYKSTYSRQFHSQWHIIAPNRSKHSCLGSVLTNFRWVSGDLIPELNHNFLVRSTNGFCSVSLDGVLDSNLGSDVSTTDVTCESLNGGVVDKKPKVVFKKSIDFTKIDAKLLPTVMIIGRPNVGKSTLYNRLIRRREALVYNTPDDHVTRDIREGIAKLGDLRFNVLDSAGIETEVSLGTILGRTTSMTANVLARTQFAVLIIDVRAGLHPLDLEVGKWLRKHAPQIRPIVVMNKSESIGESLAEVASDALALGFGEPTAISAETGLGMTALYEVLHPLLEDYMVKTLNDRCSKDDAPSDENLSSETDESKLSDIYTDSFLKVNNGENDEIEESLCSDFDEEGVINELGDADESLMNDSMVSETDGSDNNIGESSEAVRALKARYHDPMELYRELKESEVRSQLQRSEWDTVHEIFGYFAQSGWAANQALAIYIGKSFFPTAVSKFRDFFFEKCEIEIVQDLVRVGPTDEAVKFLFPVFVEFCIEEFPDEIKRFKSIVESADLTKPATWFPFARAMKRKIVYHCGPTNSGKTYNALQRFMEAKNGLYCSPLRLLAMEVFDKVNTLGIYCSLLTGQEKKHVPFSKHVSCTVEMVSTDELYEVAVIDEIQMMADPSRGHAWTKALLGLKADEIHLCGDPSVLEMVRKICADTGDELVEEHYERFKPLVVEGKTLLGDLKNVKSGDCVVAFSRREIFEVKMAIEKHTKHRCCVIYGALPPETRRQQANLFNDQENEYDVLVASDAVGMGLNLNIRRVVFYSLNKYNGDKIVPVPASQVKQIAGRAGRRGSRYPDGLTTTLHLEDLNYLIECLQQPFDEVKKVGLFPFFEQIELFAAQVPDMAFSKLLEHFGKHCRLDGSYFLCHHYHVKKVANMLEKVQGLSLEDRFNFCFAPVNVRNPKAMYHLYRFASTYSQDMPVNVAMGVPKSSAKNDTELLDLESRHQVLSMYLWLSNQFEEKSFPFAEKVEAMATNIAELLGESLSNSSWKMETKEEILKSQKKEDRVYERPVSIIQRK